MPSKQYKRYHRPQTKTLAATHNTNTKRYLPYQYRAVSRVRHDIASWNRALQAANAEEPFNWQLQLLYNEIMLDAHLSSQIENRKQQLFNAEFSLMKDNNVDEEQSALLRKSPIFKQLTEAILDGIYYGYSMAELNLSKDGKLTAIAIPRTNIVPVTGLFYPDFTDSMKSVHYRDMQEYGTWVLEFNDGSFGLLNKTVPHVLFKRFAQSCWIELCEIYGIPPRVMKTNTQDATMLSRAEKMMKDMGAAAWFIIDETENFEWAKAADTNGDVYKNLMTACRNEISLVISGAVIGQDTEHGNRSKEETSSDILWQLVKADMVLVERYWNDTIIPALKKIGWLKGDVTFQFDQTEDLAQLWNITKDSLPYFTVDPNWVKEKFGVEITGERQQQNPLLNDNSLKADFDFFD